MGGGGFAAFAAEEGLALAFALFEGVFGCGDDDAGAGFDGGGGEGWDGGYGGRHVAVAA